MYSKVAEDQNYLRWQSEEEHDSLTTNLEILNYNGVEADSTVFLPEISLYNPIATSQCPSKENFSGQHDFQLHLHSITTGSDWQFSQILNQVFIDIGKNLPLQVKYNPCHKKLYLRALPVYLLNECYNLPVERCPSHAKEDTGDPNSLHVVRCVNPTAVYETDSHSQRNSVKVLLEKPQAGTDYVTVIFKFVCKNSCHGGMSRRETAVIFTLESQEGEVYGRQVLSYRVCACPNRDRKKAEMKHIKNTNNGKDSSTSRSKKQKMCKTEDVLSIPVKKEHIHEIAEQALLYIYQTKEDEDRGFDEVETTLLNEYKMLLKPDN